MTEVLFKVYSEFDLTGNQGSGSSYVRSWATQIIKQIINQTSLYPHHPQCPGSAVFSQYTSLIYRHTTISQHAYSSVRKLLYRICIVPTAQCTLLWLKFLVCNCPIPSPSTENVSKKQTMSWGQKEKDLPRYKMGGWPRALPTLCLSLRCAQ